MDFEIMCYVLKSNKNTSITENLSCNLTLLGNRKKDKNYKGFAGSYLGLFNLKGEKANKLPTISAISKVEQQHTG